jgi:hypothetical protein
MPDRIAVPAAAAATSEGILSLARALRKYIGRSTTLMMRLLYGVRFKGV